MGERGDEVVLKEHKIHLSGEIIRFVNSHKLF